MTSDLKHLGASRLALRLARCTSFGRFPSVRRASAYLPRIDNKTSIPIDLDDGSGGGPASHTSFTELGANPISIPLWGWKGIRIFASSHISGASIYDARHDESRGALRSC